TQDIPSLKPESKIKHASPHGWTEGFNKHGVEINEGCKLATALGQTHLSVVTSHHQCIDKPGSGINVTAKSEDGLVEAVERNGERFVVGVQWHPERDFDSNQKLFGEFVKRAAAHHKTRLAQK
ncbi:MAG: gamma-glutamyl-gamma-aminobutyrate hydrolase family protein, partial [Candidatus Obscuribacterales bacterium]|nr:gamma-glutamyl-gamma-aminobutyrate hydrolase family protein [Candidatus Obscuribacterales bacterium]